MTRQASALRDLCRQSAEILADLGLDSTFTLTELHAAIEKKRQRSLYLIPRPMPTCGPCALWIRGDHADYVFYDNTTSSTHQYALIGHEFGHILFDDHAIEAETDELTSLLMPDLEPQCLPKLIARTTYERHREWRAEVFGSVVTQRLGSWSDSPPPSTADPAVLARLAAVLEATD